MHNNYILWKNTYYKHKPYKSVCLGEISEDTVKKEMVCPTIFNHKRNLDPYYIVKTSQKGQFIYSIPYKPIPKKRKKWICNL